LDAVDPAGGFVAEIKDGGGDRVRVEFEAEDGHSPRIEVRLNDGRIEVRVD
jgi:hypothetical protein